VKPRRLYLDTSVIGGFYDEEFMIPTRRLWEMAESGVYDLLTSEVTEGELENAPQAIRDLFYCSFDRLLPLTQDAVTLAQAYLEHGVVSPKYVDDALHVAIATLEAISPVVSWNFKHLVNLRREEAFNAVNLLHGHPQLRIVNPMELET
jgi:predicted nucleic acid-binding protein